MFSYVASTWIYKKYVYILFDLQYVDMLHVQGLYIGIKCVIMMYIGIWNGIIK